jgi:hypothetical protein
VKGIFFGQLSARACIPPSLRRDQQKVKKAFLRSLRLERLFWSYLAEQNVFKGFLDNRLQFE